MTIRMSYATGVVCAAALSLIAPISAQASQIFTVAISTGDFYEIDADSGASTFIGNTGVSSLGAMTYNRHTNTIYAIGRSGGVSRLYTIDQETGLGTQVGELGDIRSSAAMAYDSSTRTLYAFDSSASKRSLYSIDMNTAETTLIAANSSIGTFAGMTYDSANDVLWGVGNGNNELFTLDRNTADISIVDQINRDSTFGLAYDDEEDELYGIAGLDQRLVTINRNNGRASYVGSTGIGTTLSSLVFVPTPGGLVVCSLAGVMASRRRR